MYYVDSYKVCATQAGTYETRQNSPLCLAPVPPPPSLFIIAIHRKMRSLFFLHVASSLLFLILVDTAYSNKSILYAQRIELQQQQQQVRHLVGKKESIPSVTEVLWDNSSADEHSTTQTLKDKTGNGDEVMTTEDHKVRKQKKEFYKDCVPLDVCQYCTGDTTTLKGNNDEGTIVPLECVNTGRRQRFECIIDESETATSSSSSDSSGSNNNSSGRTEVIFQSCKSTPEEDYFAVVKMQLICLVLGIVSLREVNRQKRLSASMFDQRRYYSSGSSSCSSTASAGSVIPPINSKVTRKTSDASVNYSPVPTNDDDITEDTTPGSNSKAKPPPPSSSSTSNKNTSSTTKLNYAESAV